MNNTDENLLNHFLSKKINNNKDYIDLLLPNDINLFYIILISTYFFIIIAGMIVTHTLNL